MEDPTPLEEIDPTLRTRNGYAVADAIRTFKVTLEQSGATAAGKSLHYTADLICSGCLHLWQKVLWEYAIDHIGIVSPRIFWFLHRRFQDLDAAWEKLPSEKFYKTLEYQKTIAECLLVLRNCPRRPALKMPKVPVEAHTDEWVRTTLVNTPPSAAVSRVFRNSNDLMILRRVGDEFARACSEGATEKCLFWMKWLFEEEAKLRKDKEGTLSTVDRGPATWPAKQRNHVGFYIAVLVAELYKELAQKTGMRMHEEFQCIVNLYMHPNKVFTSRRRTELLSLAIQIICEVPRWKVPAAPALVKDPVMLERAVSHAESFFREVLAFDPPKGDIEKEAKKNLNAKVVTARSEKMSAKQFKNMKLEEHLAAYDQILDRMMGGALSSR